MTIPETSSQMLFQTLLPRLLQQAPGIALELRNLDEYSSIGLQEGRLDLLLLPGDLEYMVAKIPGLYRKAVYQEQIICLVRQGHPCLSADWSLAAYLKERHVNVGPLHGSPAIVEEQLARMGLKRDVAVAVEDFHSATSLCEMTDLVFTSTESWARHVTEKYAVEVLPLPLAFSPLEYGLYWHKRKHHDKGHQWLREQVLDAASLLKKE
ncbi:LysR substrate-binding domain-containing protein [Dongshaea marina]|uniref:LysR substrate-binding domain-containing protein n=1 Tax=Dongshaea marina TaxID=2047966 RepID=UPI000D3E9803|nr:LysR substrate-binding domain-containing protein [Dongshaea marina]